MVWPNATLPDALVVNPSGDPSLPETVADWKEIAEGLAPGHSYEGGDVRLTRVDDMHWNVETLNGEGIQFTHSSERAARRAMEHATAIHQVPIKGGVIACGDCFRYATQKARELAEQHDIDLDSDEVEVVHAVVTNPKPAEGERNRYEHAWVEYGGKVYDWQTEHAHQQPVGLREFYEERKPGQLRRYTPEQAMLKGLKSGHHGPWHTMRAAAGRKVQPVNLKNEPNDVEALKTFIWEVALRHEPATDYLSIAEYSPDGLASDLRGAIRQPESARIRHDQHFKKLVEWMEAERQRERADDDYSSPPDEDDVARLILDKPEVYLVDPYGEKRAEVIFWYDNDHHGEIDLRRVPSVMEVDYKPVKVKDTAKLLLSRMSAEDKAKVSDYFKADKQAFRVRWPGRSGEMTADYDAQVSGAVGVNWERVYDAMVAKHTTSAGFKAPYDAWKHVHPGEQPMPEPLVGHDKLWNRVAARIGQGQAQGVKQLAPVIGGRRRYHHRPLTSWLLSDGRTLTLTTDQKEANAWNALKRKRHPAMPLIYDVFSVRFKGQDKPALWAIVHERLTWPVDDDWHDFMDSFFRWRAWAKDALKPAQSSDLEDFLRFIIDPEKTDPTVTQRKRIEHVLPWQLTRSRRQDIDERRQRIYSGPDLEGKIAWAKAALKFLHTNKVRFRDFDPSNLAKTKKGGRTVVTNIAESRSLPKKTGRLGSLTAATLRLSLAIVLRAYKQNPEGVLKFLTGHPNPGVLSANADPTMVAQRSIDTLRRIARFLEREAQTMTDEFDLRSPTPDAVVVLDSLVNGLERAYKKAARRFVHLR